MSSLAAGLLALATAAGAATGWLDVPLSSHDGKTLRLRDLSAAKAVVLIQQMNGCWITRKSAPAMRALRAAYKAKGVEFLMINASRQDRAKSVAEEAAAYGLDMPILLDADQAVSAALGFTRAPEAVVLLPRDWSIVYRGAIDDRLGFGVEKPKATRRFLADALDDALAGREARVASAETLGCLINYRKP
jgi:peroxiredoxin